MNTEQGQAVKQLIQEASAISAELMTLLPLMDEPVKQAAIRSLLQSIDATKQALVQDLLDDVDEDAVYDHLQDLEKSVSAIGELLSASITEKIGN